MGVLAGAAVGVGVGDGVMVGNTAVGVAETAVTVHVDSWGVGVSFGGMGEAVVVPGSIVGVASGSAVYHPHRTKKRNNKTTTAMMISMVLRVIRLFCLARKTILVKLPDFRPRPFRQ